MPELFERHVRTFGDGIHDRGQRRGKGTRSSLEGLVSKFTLPGETCKVVTLADVEEQRRFQNDEPKNAVRSLRDQQFEAHLELEAEEESLVSRSLRMFCLMQGLDINPEQLQSIAEDSQRKEASFFSASSGSASTESWEEVQLLRRSPAGLFRPCRSQVEVCDAPTCRSNGKEFTGDRDTTESSPHPQMAMYTSALQNLNAPHVSPMITFRNIIVEALSPSVESFVECSDVSWASSELPASEDSPFGSSTMMGASTVLDTHLDLCKNSAENGPSHRLAAWARASEPLTTECSEAEAFVSDLKAQKDLAEVCSWNIGTFVQPGETGDGVRKKDADQRPAVLSSLPLLSMQDEVVDGVRDFVKEGGRRLSGSLRGSKETTVFDAEGVSWSITPRWCCPSSRVLPPLERVLPPPPKRKAPTKLELLLTRKKIAEDRERSERAAVLSDSRQQTPARDRTPIPRSNARSCSVEPRTRTPPKQQPSMNRRGRIDVESPGTGQLTPLRPEGRQSTPKRYCRGEGLTPPRRSPTPAKQRLEQQPKTPLAPCSPTSSPSRQPLSPLRQFSSPSWRPSSHPRKSSSPSMRPSSPQRQSSSLLFQPSTPPRQSSTPSQQPLSSLAKCVTSAPRSPLHGLQDRKIPQSSKQTPSDPRALGQNKSLKSLQRPKPSTAAHVKQSARPFDPRVPSAARVAAGA